MTKKEFKRKRNYMMFLALLSSLCRVINKDLLAIGNNKYDDSYLVLVYRNDRRKRIDISKCSYSRMIAIEVLKHIDEV